MIRKGFFFIFMLTNWVKRYEAYCTALTVHRSTEIRNLDMPRVGCAVRTMVRTAHP